MTRIKRGILILVPVIALTLTAFTAQAYRRGGGWWGYGSKYGKMYDPKTVETVSGTVESVKMFTPMKGMSRGVHLMVKTDKETLDVHLGPSWYVDKQKVRFEANDAVEVRGSRVTFNGKAAIIAAEVKKGGETLKLRDDNGVPVWARRGRRR